jgi:HAD superfamily phosphatase (TIGR01668 family)
MLLRPNHFARRLPDISLDDLAAAGVRGVIVDLDNTLVAYTENEPTRERLAWIAEAKARGFALVMLSNNFTDRVRRVGELLDIPTVPNALKPLPHGFVSALGILGTPRHATIVVGDQLFTDVLGARLLGLRSILLEPIADRDFMLTRVLRLCERAVLRNSR